MFNISRRAEFGQRLGLRGFCLTVMIAWLTVPLSAQTNSLSSSSASLSHELTLRQYLDRVLEYNESLQAKVLDVEIARKRWKAERGVFEPELVTSVERVDNRRQNTAEQTAALGIFAATNGFYWERNILYNGGIETLVPSGARVQLGYALRDLQNSTQNPPSSTTKRRHEFVTFAGLSMTQPLLKNAGTVATMSAIRAAAVNSEIAFQEYRRQLMLIVSTAEATYWNLFLSQEQVRAFEESVGVAETLFKDTSARAEAGKGAQLDVLEAQSGLSLRKSKLNEARQRLNETVNQASLLYAASPITTPNVVRAMDRPESGGDTNTFLNSWLRAFDLNPDYRAQKQRVILEGIKIAYAMNQSLPQLDLKGSYGLNGLGPTPADSWNEIEGNGFPSWTVGIELRVPLAGGVRQRNERDAAKLAQKKALIELKELETQMANSLQTALQKVRSREADVPNYQSSVSYVQDVLQTQLTRVEAGTIEARKVLEVEADLLNAKISLTEALVQYRRAMLERELVEGTVLKNRGLEITKAELETKTAQLMQVGFHEDERYEEAMQEVKNLQKPVTPVPPRTPQETENQEKLQRAVREKIEELNRASATNAVTTP